MLPAAIGLVVLGVILLFVIPWVGLPMGVIGVLLLIVYLVAAARRPAER